MGATSCIPPGMLERRLTSQMGVKVSRANRVERRTGARRRLNSRLELRPMHAWFLRGDSPDLHQAQRLHELALALFGKHPAKAAADRKLVQAAALIWVWSAFQFHGSSSVIR